MNRRDLLALSGYTPVRAFDGKRRKLKIETTNRNFRVRHQDNYLAATR